MVRDDVSDDNSDEMPEMCAQVILECSAGQIGCTTAFSFKLTQVWTIWKPEPGFDLMLES